MSQSWEPLPSIYRSKQEFLASLPPWRRLLQKLNWHPTIDKKVQRYAMEQRTLQIRSETEQLRRENARLAAIESRLAHFEREHLSGSTPHPSTGDSSNL
jgi:transposase-like protein